MNKKLKPKYVKRANMWVVSHIEKDKQKQSWFSTEEDGKEFIKKLCQEQQATQS